MIKGLIIAGTIILTSIFTTNTTMQVNNYVATRGTVAASWEEPEGICTEIDTEYGRGILADGYYEQDSEVIVIFDTKGTHDNYFDDDIVQIIVTE